MPSPGEYKTVQARILAYAQEIGWTFVPRPEAKPRRGFDPNGATPEEKARKASLFFGDLLHAQVRTFNPKYKEAEGALVGEFQRFHGDIYGNRDFLTAIRNQHKFFCAGRTNRNLSLGFWIGPAGSMSKSAHLRFDRCRVSGHRARLRAI